MFKTIFLSTGLLLISAIALSQRNAPPKMHDIFLIYIEKKIPLSAQESDLIRPLVINYFAELRNIPKENTDMLLKEQRKIDLKIHYRELFIPIIGVQKANHFFIEEQIFRKKVREELKSRSND